MNLDLDVDTPEKVAVTLRRAAEAYRDSQADLQSAWQDERAGVIWARIATVLDRAADSVQRAIEREQ